MADAGLYDNKRYREMLIQILYFPGFFKGTSADQDRRFSDKELKLLKSMKFPPEFDKKVHQHWYRSP